MLKCSKCKQLKSEFGFYKNRSIKRGYHNWCKVCMNIYNNNYRKSWRLNNKHFTRKWNKDAYLRLKIEVLTALGGSCDCCGEHRIAFLCVDHINGDGYKHRAEVGYKSEQVWRDIRKQGFPNDKFRVLCANCNQALAHNDVCPHQEKGGLYE